MSMTIDIYGDYCCEIVGGTKFKLPDAWYDTALCRKALPYKRFVYLGKDGKDVICYQLLLSSALDGKRKKGGTVTRINGKGYVLLPPEARRSEQLGSSVYLNGKGSYFELCLKEPDDRDVLFCMKMEKLLQSFNE